MKFSGEIAVSAEPLVLSGLAPLSGAEPRILVLGSFPSAASLALGQYYGFARNHFWLLAACVFAETVPQDWAEKRDLLARHEIALWDVAASCAREGSLDQAIRTASPNPIPAFLLDNPRVERIVLNGTKAAALFARFFNVENAIPLSPALPALLRVPGAADRTVSVVRVPSSSPVPSREYRNAADKQEAWKAALTSASSSSSRSEGDHL